MLGPHHNPHIFHTVDQQDLILKHLILVNTGPYVEYFSDLTTVSSGTDSGSEVSLSLKHLNGLPSSELSAHYY